MQKKKIRERGLYYKYLFVKISCYNIFSFRAIFNGRYKNYFFNIHLYILITLRIKVKKMIFFAFCKVSKAKEFISELSFRTRLKNGSRKILQEIREQER